MNNNNGNEVRKAVTRKKIKNLLEYRSQRK